MRLKGRNNKGFSLIQVLAIIIILGIIASIIVVNMNKNVAQSQFAMKLNQADVLYESVSKFYLENGYLPIQDPNADYLEKPVLVDLSLVAPDISEKLIGNYYLYGDENMVFYDYPEDYIAKVVGEYLEQGLNYPLLDDSIYINMEKLGDDGYLVKEPQTSYIIGTDGTVQQTYDESIGDGTMPPTKIDEGSIKDKPTTPIIIPSKLAPYYVVDTITFTAKSYYSKGIRTYEWTGVNSTNKYTEGTKSITAIAVGNDGVRSDKGTFTMVVNKQNLPPTKPVLTLNPNKLTFTSNESVVITARSTDPEGDRITYKWIGIEGSLNTATDKLTPVLTRGVHTVSVYAIDSYGNRSEKAQVTITVTNGKPVIISIDHSPKPAYNNNVVELHVKASDPDGDVITYTYQGITKTKKYPKGTHNIVVTAIDSFGAKSDPKNYALKIWNRAPYPPTKEEKVTSPSGKYEWTESEKQKYLKITMSPSDTVQKIYSYTPLTFTTTSYDHNGNVTNKDMDGDKLFYQWNVGTTKTVISSPNGSNSYKATYMPGYHTIKVRAYDDDNAYSDWVSHSFYVTNTPPTAPVISKSHSTPLYADVNISWSIGGSTDIDGHSITYHWKSTPQTRYTKGTYTVSGRALDSFGDYSTWTDLTFTVVNKPPTTPSISASPSNYGSQSTYFTISRSNSTDVDISDTIYYEYSLNGGSWTNYNPSQTFYGGSHTVSIRAYDSDGARSGTSSTSFYWNPSDLRQEVLIPAWTEEILVKAAWTEEVPIYETIEAYTCISAATGFQHEPFDYNGDGRIDDDEWVSPSEIGNGCQIASNTHYTGESWDYRVGYETVTHPAEYKYIEHPTVYHWVEYGLYWSY